MPNKEYRVQRELWTPMDLMIIDPDIADLAREALPAINHNTTHDRRAIYAPDKIFSRLVGEGAGSREEKWEFDNFIVKAQLGRLFAFRNNQKCTQCGIEGKFFLMERHVNEQETGGYSLVLYALDHNTNLVPLTADHILPDSLGGRFSTSNFQTMCRPCNQEKAHLMSLEEIAKIRTNISNHAKDWVNPELLHELLNLREACIKAKTPQEENELHQLFESARKCMVHGGDRIKQRSYINRIRERLNPPVANVAPPVQLSWWKRKFAWLLRPRWPRFTC